MLDQSVNGPAPVPESFGRALGACYAANPKAPSDTTQWTAAQRAEYEPKIMAEYQLQRHASGMTHADERGARITAGNTPLSAAPNSFVPAR